MFFDICHDKGVNYGIVSSWAVHRCKVCGRKWYCEIPPTPRIGERWTGPYWVEGWSWTRLWNLGKVGR